MAKSFSKIGMALVCIFALLCVRASAGPLDWVNSSNEWGLILATDYEAPNGSLSKTVKAGAKAMNEMMTNSMGRQGIESSHIFYLADDYQDAADKYAPKALTDYYAALSAADPDDPRAKALKPCLPLNGNPTADNFRKALKAICLLAKPGDMVALVVLTRAPVEEVKPFIVYTRPDAGETGGQVGLTREDFRLNQCQAEMRLLFIDAANTGREDVAGGQADPNYPKGYYNLTAELDPEGGKRSVIFSASGSRVGSLLYREDDRDGDPTILLDESVFYKVFLDKLTKYHGAKSQPPMPLRDFFGSPDATANGSVTSLVHLQSRDGQRQVYRQSAMLYASGEMERANTLDLFKGHSFKDLAASALPLADDIPLENRPTPEGHSQTLAHKPGKIGTPVTLGETPKVGAKPITLAADVRPVGNASYGVVLIQQGANEILFGMMPKTGSFTPEMRGEEVLRRLEVIKEQAGKMVTDEAGTHPRGLFPDDFKVHEPKQPSSKKPEDGEWYVTSPLLNGDPGSGGVVITADALFARHRRKTPKGLTAYFCLTLFDMMTNKDLFGGVNGVMTLGGAGDAVQSFTEGFLKMKPGATVEDKKFAKGCFAEAIESDASYLDAYFALCNVEIDLGEIPEAKKTLRQIQNHFEITGPDEDRVKDIKKLLNISE